MELDAAFRRIREPWRIFFDDMICRDCGMAGDERLLPPKCHDEEVVEERRACAGIPGTNQTYRVFESVETMLPNSSHRPNGPITQL